MGNTLEAALHARFTGTKLVVNGLQTIHEYDIVDDIPSLRKLGYRLLSRHQQIVNKKRLLDRLLFDMSLRGQYPITQEVTALKINPDDHELLVSLGDSRIKIRYKKLRIFDQDLFVDFPFPLKREVLNIKTYDWFKGNIINDVKYRQFVDENSSIGRKITVRKIPKNLVIVESDLKKEHIEDFDYSDTVVRLKTTRVLKEAGLTGQRNGYYVSNPDKPRYRPIKLDFLKRDMIKEYKPVSITHGDIMFDDTSF